MTDINDGFAAGSSTDSRFLTAIAKRSLRNYCCWKLHKDELPIKLRAKVYATRRASLAPGLGET
jgi:hypothetical protein